MKFIIISVLFLFSCFVFGQERFIEGITIGADGFSTNAEICLIGTDVCIETDYDGSFKLNLSKETENKEKFKILVVDLVTGGSFNFDVFENQFNELKYPPELNLIDSIFKQQNPPICGTIISENELRGVNK